MARDAASRELLLHAIAQITRDNKLSSAHVLFFNDADREAAAKAGWMLRSTVQFHWTNREPAPYADFADFLATLQRDKRKKIQQERAASPRRHHVHGVRGRGDRAERDWDFFYRCYTRTVPAHHSTPVPHARTSSPRGRTMAATGCSFVALERTRGVAASLIAIDCRVAPRTDATGAPSRTIPSCTSRPCYYQPLAWCIAHGMQRFEGGAQGEHKMARGLLPVQTCRRTGSLTRSSRRGRRLPRARRRRRRRVPRRAERAAAVQGHAVDPGNG
jgi:predicted N-acyltransferase